jgi:hypothetical protein
MHHDNARMEFPAIFPKTLVTNTVEISVVHGLQERGLHINLEASVEKKIPKI